MTEQVFQKLAPVRWRQRLRFACYTAVWGLLAASVVVLALAGVRLLGAETSIALSVGLLIAGPVIGAVIGACWQRTWHDAAIAVDSHYQFKDRATTALEFLTKPTDAVYRSLQLEDA